MRQVEGPKDMPWAARNLFENADKFAKMSEESGIAGGSTLDSDVQLPNLGLVWGTREMAELASQAAADFTLTPEVWDQFSREAQIGAAGVLMLFPSGSLPKVYGVGQMRGFVVRSMIFTQISERAMLLISIVFDSPKWSGGLLDGADLLAADIGSGPEIVTFVDGTLKTYAEFSEKLPGHPDFNAVGAFAMACLHLMMQPMIVTVDTVRSGKKDAFLLPSGEVIEPEIRKISLRPMRYVKVDHDHSGRIYSHRWVVRGHWRAQWYSASEEHRTVYIAPYLKGPEGAPLLTQPKIYVWSR